AEPSPDRAVLLRKDAHVRWLTTVAIAGTSMEPALRSGDWWLVQRTRAVRPGDVIAFWEPGRVDLLAVKRVHHAQADGWWVLGDSAQSSIDSRQYGAVAPDAVLGRLVMRVRRSSGGVSGRS
ncbi:MAG: nickel-type superoxide dismutase maturation protease, partial [Candidatus Nanopelagicales bacterium]|nr:nickel-type superoxide dismutase maturation protease [Candidatus Nanopelagicales bacterium]